MSGGKRLLRLALAVLGALLLGFLVVRVSASDALLEVDRGMAERLDPDHPKARLETAHDALRFGGRVEDEVKGAALAAFDRVPLSEVPLLIGARDALDRGDGQAADRLLEAALRRNPRSRYGLLLQLDRDLVNARPAQAATRMAVLARLFADAGGLFVSELARMARNPESLPALRRVMAADPQVRTNVLEHLARSASDPQLVLELAAATGSDDPAEGTPGWQRQLLDGLVARGEPAAALRIWQRITGAEAAAAARVRDGDFSRSPGPPPFDWELTSGGDGYAERGSGGLQVEYFGRRPVRLASQLLVLPPGRYQLAFEADGQADGEAGRLSWTVVCHPGGDVLATVPITGVGYTPKRIAGAFAVPASGCPSPWLRLEGSSAEFPKPQQATIRRLRIDPAGRS